jgi:hypothetical protein
LEFVRRRPPRICKKTICYLFSSRHALIWQQDKLEPSEQLGDLLKQAGDNEAALQCYQKANVTQKVVEGLAAKGDFAELTRFSGTQVKPGIEKSPTERNPGTSVSTFESREAGTAQPF